MSQLSEFDELSDLQDEIGCPAGWDCVEGDDESESAAEIMDDDWVTGDGCIFREAFSGKVVLDTTDMSDAQSKRAAALVMRKNQFWPNVWYVSDHGNVSEFQF